MPVPPTINAKLIRLDILTIKDACKYEETSQQMIKFLFPSFLQRVTCCWVKQTEEKFIKIVDVVEPAHGYQELVHLWNSEKLKKKLKS